ncbi:MAG: hypothetical protein WCO48_02515 [Candidatus Taylorbacteria bacterium]
MNVDDKDDTIVRPGAACMRMLKQSRTKLIELAEPPSLGKNTVADYVSRLLLGAGKHIDHQTSVINASNEITRRINMGGPVASELAQYEKSPRVDKPTPDRLIASVMVEAIYREAVGMLRHEYNEEPRNIILDGYPRNHTQRRFLHSLEMMWSAIGITIPKEVHARRVKRHLAGCTSHQGKLDTVSIRHRWDVWEQAILPAFRNMDNGRNKVLWIKDEEPMVCKIMKVVRSLGLSERSYKYLLTCLNNPNHPITAEIIIAEKIEKDELEKSKNAREIRYTDRHLGLLVSRNQELGKHVPACIRPPEQRA